MCRSDRKSVEMEDRMPVSISWAYFLYNYNGICYKVFEASSSKPDVDIEENCRTFPEGEKKSGGMTKNRK
uniref:BPTI/Kunitz inhibitor domain-containing protein n=1 Tax=Strongyloides papillosus TaxID=174720 RepID=A0A0N5C209_STREA